LILLLYAENPGFTTYNVSVRADWSGFVHRWCDALSETLDGFKWRYAAPGEAATIDYYDTRDRARQDSTRLQSDLGFAPAFPPDKALHDYTEWLLANQQFFR